MVNDKQLIALEQPVTRLHETCSSLSIAGFKQCYCFNNYRVLIIEGEPSPEELAMAWNNIVLEYDCMIKTENSTYLFDLQKRIAELKVHIEYVDEAVPFLMRRYSQKIIDELISMGYDGIYNFDDHQQYAQQLGRIKSLCKTRVMDLLDLQEEYKKYNASFETGEAQTDEEFEEWMSDLSRFQHYPINQETTTVTQWAGIINAYIKSHKTKKPITTDG